MAYEKFDPDKSDMLEVSTKYHGNISQIAKHYNVARDTVYRYQYRDVIGKQIIDEVRGYNSEFDLDIAEHVNRYHMLNYKNNPGLAQRAAEKVLDKKGHSRGWRDKQEKQDDIPENTKDQFDLLIKTLTEMRNKND